MCSETYQKKFEKTTEVLPFSKYGILSIQEFQDAEKDNHHMELLKKAGLTCDEINLYKENEAGLLGQRKKIESNAMKEKLDVIYNKINKLENDMNSSSSDEDDQPSTSRDTSESFHKNIQNKPLSFYPDGHPMNNLKDIEENLFRHLKNDDIMPITKRRKILRRLERKKDRILSQENLINIGTVPHTSKTDRPGSLWDLKEMPRKQPKEMPQDKPIVGPKKPTMYSIKDNKIVRLEPVDQAREAFRAVDIVMPLNNAEAQLLEGTKMCIDDIKKIERFKDYEPGIPSKILYLKNIAPSVTQEQLSLLFNQFMLANGGSIDVRLMTGRMRGQAFVSFQTEDIAIQALEETNGTILSGRPVIAQFGRYTNRIQDDHR